MAKQGSTKVKGNKAKGMQSSKKRAYYERQYFKTAANKIRRLQKRVAFEPKAKEQMQKIHVKSVERRPK